jgi:hypothetical protein
MTAGVMAMFWLALARVLRYIVVDGGGNIPITSLSVSEVDHYGSLCLEHGLAVV